MKGLRDELRAALAEHEGGAVGVAARIGGVPLAAAWRPSSVCALCANEEDAVAEDLVFDVFARLEKLL